MQHIIRRNIQEKKPSNCCFYILTLIVQHITFILFETLASSHRISFALLAVINSLKNIKAINRKN